MARSSIAEGRLQRVFDIESPSAVIYSFAYPLGRRKCPDINRFKRWMFDEICAEGLLDQEIQRSAAE